MQWIFVGSATLALLVLVVLAGVIGARQGHSEAAAAMPKGAFRPTEAQLADLGLATSEAISFRAERQADGRIAINDDHNTPVFSPYSGRVTRILAKPGDVVQAGQPLFGIETQDVVQAQNDLTTAMAAANKARSQVHLLEINARRQTELYAAKAAPLKDKEQAVADLAAAGNDLRAAEMSVAAIRDRLRLIGKSEHDIQQFELSGHIDRELVVTAPIAGTVTQRKVGLGQYLAPGASDSVFAIGDLSSVWLVANVRETDAPSIQIGDTVQVRVLAYPNRLFEARIAYVAAGVDPNSRRLQVRAEVDNSQNLLKPEMFASFSIQTGEAHEAVAIPEGAVVTDGAKTRVWVADGKGLLQSREVTIGMVKDGMIEVVSGLEAGESVVTRGALFIDRAGGE